MSCSSDSIPMYQTLVSQHQAIQVRATRERETKSLAGPEKSGGVYRF
jgi:hypothetical protein